MYARIYLYALNIGVKDEEVFRIRKLLFTAAQEGHIESQDALIEYLQKEKIAE
jgi:hypothetical protein